MNSTTLVSWARTPRHTAIRLHTSSHRDTLPKHAPSTSDIRQPSWRRHCGSIHIAARCCNTPDCRSKTIAALNTKCMPEAIICTPEPQVCMPKASMPRQMHQHTHWKHPYACQMHDCALQITNIHPENSKRYTTCSVEEMHHFACQRPHDAPQKHQGYEKL